MKYLGRLRDLLDITGGITTELILYFSAKSCVKKISGDGALPLQGLVLCGDPVNFTLAK